jgi:serine/threonine protein kinase
MGCLSIIHSFRIVHGDIKPENIVFSKQLKKCVFIDFGFSQIINEPLGFKTIS